MGAIAPASPEEHDQERAAREGQHGGPEPVLLHHPPHGPEAQTALGPLDLAELPRLVPLDVVELAHRGAIA
mgnify:CR=1 FL=1